MWIKSVPKCGKETDRACRYLIKLTGPSLWGHLWASQTERAYPHADGPDPSGGYLSRKQQPSVCFLGKLQLLNISNRKKNPLWFFFLVCVGVWGRCCFCKYDLIGCSQLLGNQTIFSVVLKSLSLWLKMPLTLEELCLEFCGSVEPHVSEHIVGNCLMAQRHASF